MLSFFQLPSLSVLGYSFTLFIRVAYFLPAFSMCRRTASREVAHARITRSEAQDTSPSLPHVVIPQ